MKSARWILVTVLLAMMFPATAGSQANAGPASKGHLPVAKKKTPTPIPTPPPDLRLSLKEAINIAVKHNADLREARSSLQASEADRDLAHSPYRTLLDLNTNTSARVVGVHEMSGNVVLDTTRSAQEGRPVYIHSGGNSFRRDDHEDFNFTQRITRTFRDATQLQFETSEDWLRDSLTYYDDDPFQDSDLQSSARISYTIPFNSRERLKIRTTLENAELSYKQSSNTLRDQREQVTYQVNAAYWNLKYSEENLAIQRDYLAQARQTYESFQIRNQYGYVSDFDVKQSRVAMRRIQASLLTRQARVHDDYQALNLLLGLPIECRIELTDPLEVPKQTRSDQEYIDLVLSTNLRLKTMRLAIQQSENNLAVTRLGQQPSVALVNSYQRDDGGDSVGNFLFRVSWPLGDGGATKARIRAAEKRLEEQRIRLRDEERSLRQQVLQLLRQLDTSRQELKINEENATLSKEALDIANFRFENGQIEFRDLQDAQIDLANSRINLANTTRSLNVSIAALESMIHED